MPITSFLYGLNDILVDAERYCASERQQWQVCDYTNQGEIRERQQDDEDAPEDRAGLLGIPPIDQIFHCKIKEKQINILFPEAPQDIKAPKIQDFFDIIHVTFGTYI